VRTSGGELAFVDEGEGPAVVLLHGFPTSSRLWADVVPALAPRMRVIAPDLLGYGDSGRPTDAPLDIGAQAGYVRELLSSLGIGRFAAVGHDVGGGIAQLLAMAGGVDALVLIDSVAFDAWPIAGVRMLQDATPEQETAAFVGEIVELTFGLGSSKAQGLAGRYAGAWTGDLEAARSFFRAARAIDGEGLSGRDRELAALDVPALVLWGEDDPFLPVELSDRLAALLARSNQVLLPGCSHFLPHDAPDAVASLLAEFLRARYLRLPHAHDDHSHAPAGGPVTIPLLPGRPRAEA
jgi:2-hydroxymuconate-semialdehyde hydrolase